MHAFSKAREQSRQSSRSIRIKTRNIILDHLLNRSQHMLSQPKKNYELQVTLS